MAAHSSNLATTVSASPRGIEDYAGRDAGIHNRLSAQDLVRLRSAHLRIPVLDAFDGIRNTQVSTVVGGLAAR
jgi:hypothetical protein